MRNTSPDRAPRTSHKLVGSWVRRGRRSERSTPPSAMAAGVAHTTGGSSAVRTPARYPTQAPALRTSLVAMPIGKIRPGHREAARRGLQTGLGKNGSSQGRLAAPPSADPTTRLHDRRTGPDRRARPAAASDRRRLLDRERGGPGRGVRSLARTGGRRATIHATKGAPGDRPGAANEPWKERSFQGRFAAPRAVQGSKPCSNGLAPRSPATRARISSKGSLARGISGKAADWRCIHAHFPVRNQVIP